MVPLPNADLAGNRLNQLHWIVSHTGLEYRFHAADVFDPPRWIAVHDDEVGLFAGGHRSSPCLAAKILRAVVGGDRERLDGAEPTVDDELDLALRGEPWNHPTRAGRVGAGGEQAAGLRERPLERHALGKERFV